MKKEEKENDDMILQTYMLINEFPGSRFKCFLVLCKQNMCYFYLLYECEMNELRPQVHRSPDSVAKVAPGSGYCIFSTSTQLNNLIMFGSFSLEILT